MVEPGHDLGALVQRHHVDRVRPQVRQVGRAHGEDAPIGVEGELRADHQVAALIVGQERLGAVAGPLHRLADDLGRDADQGELGIERVARAVIAADVARDHPHLVGRHRQRTGQRALHPDRAAGARVQREAPGGGVVMAGGGARLHRHAGAALYPGIELRGLRGLGEGGFGRRLVAGIGIQHDVGRPVVIEGRRPGLGGGGRVGHRGQHLVVDLHRLGGVARLGVGLGDHHRHRLAHEPHPVVRQHMMDRDVGRAAVAVLQLDVGGAGRDRRMGDGLDAELDQVLSGQHGLDARHGERGRRVDRADAGMGMGRAHEHRTRLAGGIEVVAVHPGAGQKPFVLAPDDRLADLPVEHGVSIVLVLGGRHVSPSPRALSRPTWRLLLLAMAG